MASISSVEEHEENIIDILSPKKNERILDIGCGVGHLTKKIHGENIEVVGLDKSKEKIYRARKNYPEISFVCKDAHDFSFKNCFDAVFSNSMLHWVDDHSPVLENIKDVLHEDGRFVAEFGGKGNIQTIINAVEKEMKKRNYEVYNPWYFPSIGGYTQLLEKHEFEVRYAELINHTTKLEKGDKGLKEWFKMFGGGLFKFIKKEEKEKVISSIEDRLRPYLYNEGSWFIDYKRLRFTAYLA